MANKVMGLIDCLVCNQEGELRVDKNEKLYHVCGNCTTQSFYRSAVSMDLMTARIKKNEPVAEVEAIDEDDQPASNWFGGGSAA